MMDPMTRRAFDELPQAERRDFISAGGRVIDPPPPPAPKITDPALVTRAEFDAMTAAERMAVAKSGRRIVDGVRAPREPSA